MVSNVTKKLDPFLVVETRLLQWGGWVDPIHDRVSLLTCVGDNDDMEK